MATLRKLIPVVSAIWKTLVFIGGAVSVLVLWPKIQSLPHAYGASWSEWADYIPSRETISFIFLGLALLWILWMDVRPFVYSWLWSTRPRYMAAILTIGGGFPSDNFHIISQQNVEHMEVEPDGRTVSVQFVRPIDPNTLSLRCVGSNRAIEILEKLPRRVRFTMGSAKLEDLIDMDGLTIAFESADMG